MRKKNDITNIRGIRQKHHETIDTDAAAARWGHAIFEGSNEVVIKIHRLFIASFFLRYLFAEAIRLIFCVI
jgi:hypothetical protein